MKLPYFCLILPVRLTNGDDSIEIKLNLDNLGNTIRLSGRDRVDTGAELEMLDIYTKGYIISPETSTLI